MDVGKELKRIRDANGLSAQIFADYIGIGAERMRKWESGKGAPKLEDQAIISEYFKIDLEDLPKIEKFKFYSKPVKIEKDKGIEQANTSNISDNPAINDLAKSILLLSDMGKTLADSNRDVVTMLKEEKANYRFVDKGSVVESSEMLRGFVQMAKALVRKGAYETYEEATDYLSTLLISEEEEKMFSNKTKLQDNPNKHDAA